MTTAPTLRLHGSPVSNYFNIARAALIEKGLDHEVVPCGASRDEAFLSRSPMGKIPVLETDEGWLSETVAIVEYLEDRFPQPPLLPAGAMARARARQIINIVQMYVEAPARSLFPGVFFGEAPNAAELEADVRDMLDRSAAALRRLLVPEPYLAGTSPGTADLFLFYNLDIAERVSCFVHGRSLRAEIGTLDAFDQAMRARASTRIVLADFAPAFSAYLNAHGAAYREPARLSSEAGIEAQYDA